MQPRIVARQRRSRRSRAGRGSRSLGSATVSCICSIVVVAVILATSRSTEAAPQPSGELVVWVATVLDPSMTAMSDEMTTISDCEASGLGFCSGYDAILESEVATSRNDPAAPNATIEADWLAILRDFSNLAKADEANNLDLVEQVLDQYGDDLNRLAADLTALGVPGWSTGTGAPLKTSRPTPPPRGKPKSPPTTAPVTSHPPAVLSVSASPSTLGPGGGSAVVTGKVEDGTTCQLRLLSRQSFPVVYASNERSCSSNFSAHVEVGANPSALRRVIAFVLVVRNKVADVSGRFYISIQGAFPAKVLSARAVPATIGPNGGTVRVVATVAHARTCVLKLFRSEGARVDYSEGLRACSGGSFQATVVVGANPGRGGRDLGFDLVARNSTSESSGKFYVTISAPYRPEVVSVSASPENLGAKGGMIMVRAVVKHAVWCSLRVSSSKPLAVGYSAAAAPCANGTFSTEVTVGRNTSYATHSLKFEVVAKNTLFSSYGSSELTVDGEIFTPSITMSAQSVDVPLSGGKLKFVEHIVALTGSECSADLQDEQSGQDWPSSIKCSTGVYEDDITFGAVEAPQTYVLTLMVYGPNERTVSKAVTITQNSVPTRTTTTWGG